jgi:adenosylcobinamide-GDP ribazoletransferase
MAAMKHELRLFFIALQFLTRVPVPRWVGFEPDWLNASARHFPAVGLLVGGVAALVYGLAGALFASPWVAAWLSMAATLVLTGGFHEDGWADTCDGLGGAVSRPRALEIMKDSRIGAYGAMGLVMMLGLKAAVLASLSVAWVCAGLLLAHTVSRAAAVSLLHFLPYAGDAAHAKAKPLAQHVSIAGWGVAVAWGLGVGAMLLWWNAAWWTAVALSFGLAVLVTLVCARWFWRRLGGVTGDTLGATQQLTEVAVLMAWLAMPPWWT